MDDSHILGKKCMANTDQTLTNNFTAGDMADQAAKAFRDGLDKAIEIARIYGHVSLAAHLEHLRDNPDVPYAPYTSDELNRSVEDVYEAFLEHDKADFRINGLWFKLTCGACPEQYDVFRGDEQVAYVRLRFGRLRVDVPDVGGKTIYISDFDEEYKGVFSDEAERVNYLAEISEVIGKHYSK